jgi:hypothetical protein
VVAGSIQRKLCQDTMGALLPPGLLGAYSTAKNCLQLHHATWDHDQQPGVTLHWLCIFSHLQNLLVTYGARRKHRRLYMLIMKPWQSSPGGRSDRRICVPVLKPRPGLVLPAGLVLNERSLSDQPVPAKTYLAWSPVSGGDTADWLRAMISRVR